MQLYYTCPNCGKELKYDSNSDNMYDITCVHCGQICELDYEGDGLSAHHWYAIKKEFGIDYQNTQEDG